MPSVPFREFIIKVSSRCNLACEYCYVYAHADQSWRRQPPTMDEHTLAQTARRIAEHAHTHQLERVTVHLHGGEPLLLGPAGVAEAARILRGAVPSGVEVALGVQTNGTLLDEEMLAVFAAHRIRVGVSIDGTAQAHDRHRVSADGRPTHARVDAALLLLGRPDVRDLFAGVLCVVDVHSPPLAVYRALLRYRPPRIDLLFPHRTWAHGPEPWWDDVPAHGAWLAEVFAEWFTAEQRETRIRLFEEILHTALGGMAASHQIGLAPAAHVVVETDGTIQQVDTLKVVAPGAPETGLDVFTNRFDDALELPAVKTRQIGLAELAPQCQACPLVQVCGGGHYAHRYRPGFGFANPSVYCASLSYLIRTALSFLGQSLPDLVTANPPTTGTSGLGR
jgi:uncharacterized protein